MAIIDATTIGVLVGWAIETTAGTMPTAYTQIPRCKSVGAVDLSTETIDVSALEDAIERAKAGRQSTGGEWNISFLTGAIPEIKEIFTAYQAAKGTGKRLWFTIYVPEITTMAWFVSAQPGTKIPLSEISENTALIIDLSLTIEEYHGLDTAIKPLPRKTP